MAMNKSKILLALAGVLIAINTIALVLMWTSGKGFGKPSEMQPGKGSIELFLKKELSLTDDQFRAYSALIKEHRALSRTLNETNRTDMNHLMQSIRMEQPDTLKMVELSQRMGQNEAQKALNTAYHFHQFRELLTAGQKTKFDALLEDVIKMMAPAPPRRRPQQNDGPPGGFSDGPPPRSEDGPADRPSPPGPRPE